MTVHAYRIKWGAKGSMLPVCTCGWGDDAAEDEGVGFFTEVDATEAWATNHLLLVIADTEASLQGALVVQDELRQELKDQQQHEVQALDAAGRKMAKLDARIADLERAVQLKGEAVRDAQQGVYARDKRIAELERVVRVAADAPEDRNMPEWFREMQYRARAALTPTEEQP